MRDMQRTIAGLLSLLLICACSSGPDLVTLESVEADFGAYSTYAFDSEGAVLPEDEGGSMAESLRAAAARELNARGYEYSEDPDLLIRVSLSSRDAVEYKPTTFPVFEFRPLDENRGAIGYQSKRVEFVEGALVVRAVDTQRGTTVWKGAHFRRLGGSEDLAAAIDRDMKELFRGYPFLAGSDIALTDRYGNSALEEFEPRARRGDAEAQFAVGVLHHGGFGTAKSESEAARWYGLAARQGHAMAAHRLGLFYLEGRGVAQDYGEARRWLGAAADEGVSGAQHSLGWMYLRGLGVERDDVAAASLLRQAAEQGSALARADLGLLFLQGRGVEQSDQQALKWFQLAAAQDNRGAQRRLGMMYENGRGTEQDEVKALVWYSRSAAGGDATAADQRDALARRLSPEQLEETQRRMAR